MSGLDTDLQDVLGLEAEEDISYEDCLHDQELSFVASMECCSVDFNSRGICLSKVKF